MDKSRGFTLIEVLISMLIMAIGLLGLAGMQAVAQRAEVESYQRAQALVLVQDMVDRVNANRKVAGCYAFTPTAGSLYAGTGATAPTCAGAFGTAQQRDPRPASDLAAARHGVHTLGVASLALLERRVHKHFHEALGANQVGAMVGARGCVILDTTVAPNVYRVQVAWQGMTPTVNPTSIDAKLTCATGQYGTDLQRRVISQSFPMACLNC